MIRVIDLQFVMKTAEDEIVAMETSSLSDEEAAEFGAVIGGLIGLAEGGLEGAVVGAEVGALHLAVRDLPAHGDIRQREDLGATHAFGAHDVDTVNDGRERTGVLLGPSGHGRRSEHRGEHHHPQDGDRK